jgi:hypothetical protein
LEWVWLAESTDPFTKIPERLKYRAAVSRGRVKELPDAVSCERRAYWSHD